MWEHKSAYAGQHNVQDHSFVTWETDLGGEHVESAGPPVLYQSLQDRDVVTQRLATSSTSGHNHVLAGHDSVNSLSLVCEHLVDAPGC